MTQYDEEMDDDSLDGFDAELIEPRGEMELLPVAKYQAVISASKKKPTKDEKGSYREVELTIIEGPYENRKVWDRLNLENPSQQAVEIAQRTLSAICHATGILRPKNFSELHDIPMVISVGIEKGTGKYSDKNKIAAYLKLDATKGTADAAPRAGAAPARKTATAAAPAAPAKPAWQRAKSA